MSSRLASMTRLAIIVLIAGAVIVGGFFYIRNAERAKLENANTKTTIEGIRDARTIENETRSEGDGGLLDYLLGRVRTTDGE